jgi:pilus assembly protein CpaF
MDREKIFETTLDRYLAPVDRYRRDPAINEIMINGPDEVYVERAGKMELTDVKFSDPDRLFALARNLAQYTNQRITPITARFDSRLPDKSRVHVVLPRCSREGLCISIRKFSLSAYTLEKYVELRSLTPESREYLEIVIALEMNIIVSGGTGTGKTSFLNALSREIDRDERIIVIEDTSELQFPEDAHVLRFEVAAPNRKGEGRVTIRDLFHSALRMRPDRIVIGECRGGEALDLIQAMTSGHGGSMSTLHANSPVDALRRLETMALMSGVEIPLHALRAQVSSAIDLVVQLTRLNDGRRVVSAISEVVEGVSGSDYIMNPVFERTTAGSPLRWTEKLSQFRNELRGKGLVGQVKLAKEVFGVADSQRPN